MTENAPTAVLKPRRRISAAWIVPGLAVVLAGWLAVTAFRQRGHVITVHLDHGHGLKAGDPIRFRGITVGEVLDVHLDDLDGVRVTGTLTRQARELARAGTRFWVVRPRLTLDQVAGLETLIGPRVLAVLPGDGAPQRSFVGLAAPPVVESIEPGDLEVILEAPAQRGLRAGAPVLYRGLRVGAVMSVGLTSDAGAVEARLHVEKAYAPLVRPETRFWSVGGVEAGVSLRGMSVKLDSLQSLVAGGVALATPPGRTPTVRTGHRFRLEDEVDEDWLQWQPMAAIGSSMLPPGASRPTPLRATVGWREGLLRSRRSRQGWLLPTETGLLGPLDLLQPDEDARPDSLVLEVAGVDVPIDGDAAWSGTRLAVRASTVGDAPWPSDRMRSAGTPEDCLVIGDPTADPVPLSAARLAGADGGWRIDAAVALDARWHGACVLSREDGRLVGILIVADDDDVTVAWLPESLLSSGNSPTP